MTTAAARPRVLVVTTVHPPDDPRVRHRTVASLATAYDVRFATMPPGPAVRDDHEWVCMDGPRATRAALALKQMLRRDVDLVSLHDPELVPAGVLASRLRGVPVVFDVHEDYVARAAMREGITAFGDRLAVVGTRRLLAAAERRLVLTLAESGYQRLFEGHHPVLPNHPLTQALPDPRPPATPAPLVYVGDVTPQRGALLAVRAAAASGLGAPLVLVGRCDPDLATRLVDLGTRVGVQVEVLGWRSWPQAMAIAAGALVALSPLLDVPNYRRSLPTKVLEYAAMGVPVVASDLPGTSAAIGGLPGTRLVPPGDPWAMGRALRWAADPRRRADAASNAAAVRATFSWEGDHLVRLYGELIDGAASRGRRARTRSPTPGA